MTEPEWYRQRGLACEFCGAPGHYVAVMPPMSVVAGDTALDVPSVMDYKRVTCPEHRFLVRSRAENELDPVRFAERDHGRPVLGEEPYPERMRRSIGTIVRRLGGWDGPEDGR